MNISKLGKILILTLGFSSFHQTIAQTQIFGKAINHDQNALEFANALLLSQHDSSLVKGALTNNEGIFFFQGIQPGNYLVQLRMAEYGNVYSPNITIHNGDATYDVGTVKLEPKTVTIGEVEITAEKPMFEQQIDRMVVNVQNSITAAGGSAMDILERSPGIIADRQNGSLSMSGKQGVIVMINGKQSRTPLSAIFQLLEGMNADNIEKIELITTPPAKFDAEGDAGIINIVLKKNTDYGLNGSFSLNAGYGFHDKEGGSINLNYRKNKLNLFGDYSFARNHTDHVFSYGRKVDFNGDTNEIMGRSDRDPTITNHTGRFGFDYELSSKTIIGGIVSGYSNKWEMTALNSIHHLTNGVPTFSESIANSEINQWQNIMGNLNLTHSFDKTQKLSMDVDYLKYHNNNPSEYINEITETNGNHLGSEEFRVGKETPLDVYVAKVDYTKDFGADVKLEVGIKGTSSRFMNDVSVEKLINSEWISNPELTNTANLAEDIGAAYTSLRAKLSKKTTLQAGIRYEYTNTHLGTPDEPNLIDRQYGNFFPSLYLAQDINEQNRVQVSYSRRIARPTFNEMAPFVIFLDPNTFFGGNASLRPAITDALKLDYRWKTLFMSLSYSHDTDAIMRFQPRINPETNEQIMFSENIDDRNTYNLMIAYPLKITDWWETQTNIIGTIQTQSTIFEGELIESSQKSLAINGSQKFKLPADFSFELSGFFRSSVLFGIARMKSMGATNAGLQKTLPNNQGSFSLTIQDIFWTRKLRFEGSEPSLNLDMNGQLQFEPRVVRLTYSRNFGSNTVKARRKRATGSDAEQKRVTN